MTSTYDARGRRVGATVLEVRPNIITQVKTVDGKDGYNAIQLGTGSKKEAKKPQLGQLKKWGIDQKLKWIKELRVDQVTLKPGQSIDAAQVFSAGDAVKVTGVSKGKGFAGVVKRWGFAGGPRTHGQSDRLRAPGSIGAGTDPGRVYKGKKMAGRMGGETATVRGLEVILVDKENNTVVVKGAVPGALGSLVVIEKIGKIKGYTPPPEPELAVAEEISRAEDQKTDETEAERLKNTTSQDNNGQADQSDGTETLAREESEDAS